MELVDKKYEIYELDRGWFSQNVRFRPVKRCLEGAKIWIRGVASVGTSDYCTYWGRLLVMRGEGPFSPKMALKPIEDLQRSNAVEEIWDFRFFTKREMISTIKHKFRE